MYNPKNDPNSLYYLIDDSRDEFYGDSIPGMDE